MRKLSVLGVILLILMQITVQAGLANPVEPAEVEALKLPVMPTFDGVINSAEWGEPTLKNVIAGSPAQAFKTDGAPDLTWSAWLRWDDNYFYVALETGDTKHVNKQEGPALWGGDSMQLKLDPLGNWKSQGKTDSTYVSNKALDLIFVLSTLRNVEESYCWNKESSVTGAKMGIKNANGKTSYEVGIPWAFLDSNPTDSNVIGLSIGRLSSSNDATDPGEAYDGCLEWGSGTIVGRTDLAACGTNKVTLLAEAETENNTQTSDSLIAFGMVMFMTLAMVFIKKKAY